MRAVNSLKLVLSFAILGVATTLVASPFIFTSSAKKRAPAVMSQPVVAQDPVVNAPKIIGTCDTAGPIEVESSGGVTSPTAYGTLKLAFDAINAGTHTGSIKIRG